MHISKEDFVALSWTVFFATMDDNPNYDRGFYKDSWTTLRTRRYLPQGELMEVIRAGIKDHVKTHLQHTNPVVLVSGDANKNEYEIVRFHGEHSHLVGHFLWLVARYPEYQNVVAKIVEKYPGVEAIIKEGF